MTELIAPPKPDQNVANYSRYKEAVDRAERRKAWLGDNSFKGTMKRVVDHVVKTVSVQSTTAETNNDLAAPFEAAQDAKHYFAQNEEAVKRDAIHDASAAGVDLNLPENGLPETVTNVQIHKPEEKK